MDTDSKPTAGHSSYAITLPEEGDYVLVKVTGLISREFAVRFVDESRRVGAASGMYRYLFDVRDARNVETALGNYQYAHEDMARLELDRRARLAILAAVEDPSHDFVETVMSNVGYNVRLFRDKEQAVAWLREA